MREKYFIHGYDIETGGFYGPPNELFVTKPYKTMFGAKKAARKIQEELDMCRIFIQGSDGVDIPYNPKIKK